MTYSPAWTTVGKWTLAAAWKIRAPGFFTLILVASMALSGCERGNTTPQRRAEAVPVENTGTEDQKAATEAAEEAPLLLEDEPLLLLDEDAGDSDHDGPMADNSRCFVCHVNYMTEEIAVTHAKADMGCAACHGPSDAHIADESWASGGNGTAPDIMFPKAEINPACMTCHSRSTIDTPQHAVLFASDTPSKVCTDCHGNHRLHERRCKWK